MPCVPRLFVPLALGSALILLPPMGRALPAQPAPARTRKPAARLAQLTEPERLFVRFVTREREQRPTETAEERRFVELANQERAKLGLGTLEIDPMLTAIARQHSTEMRDKDYFNHESPTAGIRTPMDRYRMVVELGPKEYACVGENLYYSSVMDIQRGHDAFMNSPTHRENVVFPRFNKIGVGIVKSDRGEFWVTQMYLTNTPPDSVASGK